MRKVMASKSSVISVRPVIRPDRSIFAMWPWLMAPSYTLGSMTLAVNLSPSQLVAVVSLVSRRILSRAPSGTSGYLPSLSVLLILQRDDTGARMRDIRRNSQIESAPNIPVEISDFKTQAVPLFIVYPRAEARFITSIGFMVKSVSLVVAPHPIGEIVLPRVVAIGVPRSVTMLVSYAELNTVTTLLLRGYAGIQRQRQAEQ
jgi:hypothetical protein